MEALTLSSPMIITVVGLPGSGKSFFASQFANTFGSAIVSNDRIRWTLFSEQTYSDSENSIVDQVSDIMIEELLRTKKTFVIDGGYNLSAKRRALRTLAARHGFRMLTIIVQTDEPTTRRRALRRNPDNAGDIYKQSISADMFEQAKRQYQEPSAESDDVVIISGKHTYNTQAKSVLKRMIEVGKGTRIVKRPPANRSTLPNQGQK